MREDNYSEKSSFGSTKGFKETIALSHEKLFGKQLNEERISFEESQNVATSFEKYFNFFHNSTNTG